ncbi:MAG TPA: polyprenyl synthetase family protein [Dehalococcoidia bacterium]|nr:polyprenyl synthetase family protein [Dehalococcoidia bacterium]
MRTAPPLARYRREVDEYLRSLVPDRAPQPLYQMVRYHLGWEDAEGRPDHASGKGLRSSLCLLTCEAAGGELRQALPAAAAVELVHNFSLVHDDIQDRDAERHHRPTVWKLWGEAQAINAGDAILALAHLTILRLGDEGVSAPMVFAAARALDERTLEMVEGQTLDIWLEDRLDVGLPGYIEMIEKKTGALFDCALTLGALVAGADSAVIQQLGSIGRTLGTAFQIRDDMLGIWGDVSKTGKPRGADIRRRKKSSPLVYALNDARSGARHELRAIYGKPALDDEDVARVLSCLEDAGAQDYCVRLAAERKESALVALGQLELKPRQAAEFREAAEFLLEREF